MAANQSVASAMEGGGSMYPIAVLIDDVRSEDLDTRMNAVQNLHMIAEALGPERTRDELVPFLQETLIDDDAEILTTLADQLGSKGISLVGGPSFAYSLISPLEELASAEEVVVRDAAADALKAIVPQMPIDHMTRHLCAAIARLACHDWYTSRISACSLFAAAMQRLSSGSMKQDDLLKTFFRLCSDDTPMVRRQAVDCLGEVAKVVTNESSLSEILEVFKKLSKDEQDSVRILSVNNCVTLGQITQFADWQGQILTVVKACAEDKSWRVRYMVADQAKQLCEVFKAKAGDTIVSLYIKLLSDPEAEVRIAAASRLSDLAGLNPTKEFLEAVLPSIEKLTQPRELSMHVRATLASAVLSLAPVFGTQLTIKYLISVVLQLIRDESPEVRLSLIGKLSELSSVVGGDRFDMLSQSLLPSIKELAKDRQWRVRLALLQYMPSLAKHLGKALFTKELQEINLAWLADPAFSVRDAAGKNLEQLAEILGVQWAEASLMPYLVSNQAHENYLYRISAMQCGAGTAKVLSKGSIEEQLIPMVLKMATDPVPNVRFNVPKAIEIMFEACVKATSSCENQLLSCLRTLKADKDPEVKHYAEEALKAIGK